MQIRCTIDRNAQVRLADCHMKSKPNKLLLTFPSPPPALRCHSSYVHPLPVGAGQMPEYRPVSELSDEPTNKNAPQCSKQLTGSHLVFCTMTCTQRGDQYISLHSFTISTGGYISAAVSN